MGPKELPVVKEEEDEEEEEEMQTVVLVEPEEKWDCETIISELKKKSEIMFFNRDQALSWLYIDFYCSL